MRRLFFLLFCASCAWLTAPNASAAPARRYPLPGNHRPVYRYYHGPGAAHRGHSFWSLFQHHSGTHKVKPHTVRGRRGTL